MQYSPKGRFIEYVEGSPDGIIERGEAIKVLGDQMLDSADVLENIKNRAIESAGQKGQAIDALRESIGDSYETLREAGELYQPVGPVISTYGHALDSVQPLIKATVDDSRDLWDTYVSLPGQLEPRGTGGLFQPDEGTPEAEQQAEEDATKKAAYDAWEARAEDFDAHYDTWEDAFDTAVDNIGDEMAGSIKDSRWSDFWDFMDGVADILGKIGLVVGVLALVFAGPFLAIAAAIAVLGLLVASIRAFEDGLGWNDLGDVGLAALACLPMGKLGTLFGKGGVGRFGQETLKQFEGVGDFRKISAANKLLGGGTGNWFRIAFQNGNQKGAVDVLTRVTLGKDVTTLNRLSTGLDDAVITGSSAWNLLHGQVGATLKAAGWTSLLSGSESVTERVPALDILW